MDIVFTELKQKVGKVFFSCQNLPRYFWHRIRFWWYHKLIFGITNTKFDISFCVFQESFVNDQYDIRRFLDEIRMTETLFFFDIGRNHGFVFYYMMYHIMRSNFNVSVIDYVGIDPSPLKFVYFNKFNFLRKKNIKINYHLIDRAVVFNNESHVKLKYGENNYGNFNVIGSNYAQKLANIQNKYSYIDIDVETISVTELKRIFDKYKTNNAIIIKIDCKNQTVGLFLEFLDIVAVLNKPYLVACEKDDSGDRDVTMYSKLNFNVLTASNVFSEQV